MQYYYDEILAKKTKFFIRALAENAEHRELNKILEILCARYVLWVKTLVVPPGCKSILV